MWKKLVALAVPPLTYAAYVLSQPDWGKPEFNENATPPLKFQTTPSRRECMEKLRSASTPAQAMDVLVIGGGCAGCAVALDAATRGLTVGLIERDDYSSGTSSRSTKLLHGGVRYLEKAILNFDREQLGLVKEALRERAVAIHMAPHLCKPLPTMFPLYDTLDVIQVWIGMKLYDLLSVWSHGVIAHSYFLTPVAVLNRHAKLQYEEGDLRSLLLGGVVYYDGQMDDARLCVSTAMTAASYGAATTNHTELVNATVGESAVKATVRDRLTGSSFDVYAKSVVNATGPYSDAVRAALGDKRPSGLRPSSGTHITVPAIYGPKDGSAMIVRSPDNRVIFAIPWQGSCILGTTDEPTVVTDEPRGTAADVKFILDSVKPYVGTIPLSDVKSVWCGIRPLATKLPPADAPMADQDKSSGSSTQEVVREHMIDVDSAHRVVSITGGKWTTFRKIAWDAVEALNKSGLIGRPIEPSVTEDMKLVGGHTWSDATLPSLRSAMRASLGETLAASIRTPVEDRWLHAFGDRCTAVAKCAAAMSKSYPKGAAIEPLATAQAITVAEIGYCCEHEHCSTISDYLQRRSRLAFLDVAEAMQVIPKVAEVMQHCLGWSNATRKQMEDDARRSMLQFTAQA